jgi:diguanylate cyclase (GGDEF)-like protein/PAS domain S-box-containing protein
MGISVRECWLSYFQRCDNGADKELVSSVRNTVVPARAEGAFGDSSAPELLNALTTHTPVGVFVSDSKGACVFVNERWCELTGLGFAEALGDGWSMALHPDDQDRVAAEWRAAATEQRDSTIEYRFLRPDGSVAWVKGYASAVYGTQGLLGWVGSCIELTEYRVAMQQLTNERETFRAAFDDAPIGMALVAPSGRFLRVNDALCRIVGCDPQDLLEVSFQDITHPDDLDADVELAEQLLTGKITSYRLEKRYQHPAGNAHWVAVSVSLIRSERAEPLHFVVHVEDINERKLAEHRLRRQADHDSLTGLLNRRRLLEELELRIERIARGGTPADLIMLDLDHFKHINDSLGHAAGDQALIAVGRALKRRMRKTDIIARLGGDEFAVIAETNGEPGEGELVADDLLAAIRTGEPGLEQPWTSLTASAGIAVIEAGQSVTTVLEAADQALYGAKHSGRDHAERFASRSSHPPDTTAHAARRGTR